MAKKANKITAIAPPKDTGLGPNPKFPFGIKLVDKAKNISWERFKSAKERDTRIASLGGANKGYAGAVDYSPADKPIVKPIADVLKAISKPAEPAAKPPAAKKPAAEPAKPKADTLALHLNKTGRLCFLRGAAARLTEAGFAIDEQYFMALAIDKGLIRLEPKLEASADTVEVRDGGGRPYVSLTRQLKPWGFDGSRAIDIPNVKPYGKGGFEFRLS